MLLWCTVFGMAFGVIEGAVVVYLRRIAYPDGFAFPLKDIPPDLLRVELIREAATLVLLVAVARLAAKGGLRRFAVFAFCFGVWDLAYYVVLKALLDWPAHILDWDILFLIPLPWTAPVLAPVLVSVALIGAGVAILLNPDLRVRRVDWIVESVAGLVIIATFLWNVPAKDYPWWLFAIGLLGGVTWFAIRPGRSKPS